MPPVVELLIEPQAAAISRATESLRGLLPPGVPQEQTHAIEIAIAEVLTNIALHGFEGRGGPPVRLRWDAQPASLRVQVWDAGRAIPAEALASTRNPFDFDPRDLDQLPEGGMGLWLIRAAFDSFDYRPQPGDNQLTLIKNFPESL